MLGTVPLELNMAYITPIFKNKGSANLSENYRPISVVTHLAKLLGSGMPSAYGLSY